METTRRGFLGALLAVPAALRAIPGIAEAPPGGDAERQRACVHCLEGAVHVSDPEARKILQRDMPAGAKVGVVFRPSDQIVCRAEGSYLPVPEVEGVYEDVVMVPCPTCRPSSYVRIMKPVAEFLYGDSALSEGFWPPLVASRAGAPHPFYP